MSVVGLLLVSRQKSFGLHAQMHLVLEARVLAFRQQLGVVRDDGAEGLHPRTLVFAKVAEHVAFDQTLHARMPNADAHAPIVVSDVSRDRPQPVMAGNATAALNPHLAPGKVRGKSSGGAAASQV